MRPFRRGPKRVKYEVKNGVTQPVLLERHVLREIMDRLWYQARIKVWQINQPVGGKVQQNVSGIPDLIGFIPSHHSKLFQNEAAVPVFIEVKRPGGVKSFEQEQFIEEAKKGGCVAFFAHSWTEVIKEFAKIGIILKGDI